MFEYLDTRLNSAFSGIGPLAAIVKSISQVAGAGWGVSFSVAWRASDPITAERLAREIRAYDGELWWAASKDFNGRGVEASALPKSLSTDTKPISSGVSEESLERDVDGFAKYFLNRTELRAAGAGWPQINLDRREAYGLSAYDVYAIRHPDAFGFDEGTFELLPTSGDDYRIHTAILDEDLDGLSRELRTAQPMTELAREFVDSLFDRHHRVVGPAPHASALTQALQASLDHLSDPGACRVVERICHILDEVSKENLTAVFEPTR